MSALRIHSLPHSICLKNVSVQKVKDVIQYLSFQTDLWICGTGGGMGRQCRKRWESARKRFLCPLPCPAWPRVCFIFEQLFRSCGCDADCLYTLWHRPPNPTYDAARPLATEGQCNFPVTANPEARGSAKLWLSSINIFISLSLPLRCWDLCLPCS